MTHGKIFVVYGPQGCGKTRNADLLKKELNANRVIDPDVCTTRTLIPFFQEGMKLGAAGLNVLVLSEIDFDNVAERERFIGKGGREIPATFIPYEVVMENIKNRKTGQATGVLCGPEAWDVPELRIQTFGNVLEELAYSIHEQNVKVGWWDELEGMNDRQRRMLFAEKLALVHSEVSEALEGVRKDSMDDKLPWRKMAEVEISDAIIRLLDLAKGMGFEVGAPLVEKLAYNATRADHKRENRNAPGGKAF